MMWMSSTFHSHLSYFEWELPGSHLSHSRLSYNGGTWHELSQANFRTLGSEYMKGLRAAHSLLPWVVSDPISDSEVLSLLKRPSVQRVVSAKRLLMLPRIVASGNPILIESHARLMMRVRLGRHMALLDRNRWSEAMDEHEQMMHALRQYDSGSVAGIWRRHLLKSGQALAQQVTEAGLRTAQEPA